MYYLGAAALTYAGICVGFKWWHRRFSMGWEDPEGFVSYDAEFRAKEDERWGINREALDVTWTNDASRVHDAPDGDHRLPMPDKTVLKPNWRTQIKSWLFPS